MAALYILCGVLGLPVFAGGGYGLGVFLGHTVILAAGALFLLRREGWRASTSASPRP